MKVLDLRCTNQHRFEGWFGSAEEFRAQLDRRLVTCPICNSAEVTRLPSAPRLNRGTPDAPAASAPPVTTADATDPAQKRGQADWLHAVRQLLRESEDVGDRFAHEARRIHHGEVQARSIRGQATGEEAASLREEGIAVLPLVLPEVLKGPVH